MVDIEDMTNPVKIGESLDTILKDEKSVFIRVDTAIADFTKLANYNLCIFTKKATVKVPLQEQLNSFVDLLKETLFTPGRTLIAWDIKPLLTYLRFHVPNNLDGIRTEHILDLRLLEQFSSVTAPPPTSWIEAMKRAQAVTKPAALRIHKLLHRPLATSVIPDLETWGVVDLNRRRTVFPCYNIEGQVTGRLSSYHPFDRAINSHSLAAEQKEILEPRPPHTTFVQFDFRAMEVGMLQWLSEDKLLGEILADEKKDIYEEVFKIITGSNEASSEDRALAKSIFLPVFYGLQAYALAERIGVNQDMAQSIIDLVSEKFSTAWTWVEEQQQAAKESGQSTDFFGRIHKTAEKDYLARQFSIAAPAAAVCLEKLISLHRALDRKKARIVFSVHDAYFLSTYRVVIKEVIGVARKVLEEESALCPGLKIRTKCEAGKNLVKLVKAY